MFMKNQKTKIFPKIKKNLKNFLTDESGKITKKDALWVSVVSSILLLWNEAFAGHSDSICGGTPGHANQAALNAYDAGWHISGAQANHSSGIVNGHYNRTNAGAHQSSLVTGSHVNQVAINESTCTHASHASHGSHGSRW